jgi:ribosomal protein L11 methyltransferase
MSWWEASIACESQEADFVCTQLESIGAQAVSLMDLSGQPIFEPNPDEAPLWDKIKCVGLFDQTTFDKTKLNDLISTNLDGRDISITALPEQDWMKLCQTQFQAQRFGNNLWVCPSWSEVAEPNAVVLKLDPGLAFGTGTHPTTALCLDYIASLPLEGQTVIDFGCGSGILGIAAALLGAKRVISIDHDPQAILSTEENAKQNNVELTCYHSKLFVNPKPEADLLVANILASPLIKLAPTISAAIIPGGTLILSGLLVAQIDAVLSAYLDEFDFETPRFEEDWVCLIGKKREADD